MGARSPDPRSVAEGFQGAKDRNLEREMLEFIIRSTETRLIIRLTETKWREGSCSLRVSMVGLNQHHISWSLLYIS
jgi:hypothetical protein